MSKSKSSGAVKKENNIFAENKKAYFKYEFLEKFEAGIVLTGSEVKSVRAGQISLAEAWIGFINLELWLKKANIAHYKFDASRDYDPIHDRKLLLHKSEALRLSGKMAEKGFTLIPLKVYAARGKIKVEVGLGRGMAKYDKRRKIKEKDEKRALDRQLKRFV
ncbi:MAG: SsrA-binding protein SmpB [Patescibacteria group bacterium]|nr:SsrA-binding protein SmpB [Patescibacteria group bacterium]